MLTIDAQGLRCPQPVLKLATGIQGMEAGAIVELIGDCPTLESDIHKWCERTNRTVLVMQPGEGEKLTIQIRI